MAFDKKMKVKIKVRQRYLGPKVLSMQLISAVSKVLLMYSTANKTIQYFDKEQSNTVSQPLK